MHNNKVNKLRIETCGPPDLTFGLYLSSEHLLCPKSKVRDIYIHVSITDKHIANS